MKIYTKTGDTGQTSLFAGGRVSKDDARLHAYGTVDELNSILGVVIAMNTDEQIAGMLRRVQGECFALGADLATPLDADAEWIQRLGKEPAERLEAEIDAMQDELTHLQHFILPGGTPTAAFLHQARTVCRRAERWMVTIREELNPQTLIYVNRLSDWLFVLARLANSRAGVEEPIWESHSDD